MDVIGRGVRMGIYASEVYGCGGLIGGWKKKDGKGEGI